MRVLNDSRADNIDFVLVRESTEGLFASCGKGEVLDDREARDTMVITRETSEQLFEFTFDYARRRKASSERPKVTLVDKANIFISMAFFRKVFDEAAEKHSDIDIEHVYVDACALDFVRRPWEFDVVVTENMFGDILSDLAAGLVGGMGFAPSADIGDQRAVFQPAHGSAPDIVGLGTANPTAAILSGAMMLEWLGRRHGVSQCLDAARLIEQAVEQVLAEKRMNATGMIDAWRTSEMTEMVIGAIG
jgi:3-isopropylmalate dehydrogenase